MADVVFVLGAGASQRAGAPLMENFLDVAHELYRLGKVDDSKEQFETVFDAISELQNVHSKSRLDIQNVEAVFSAFEMAQTLGRFGDYSETDLESLTDAMRVVIVQTIENTMQFPVQGRTVLPPVPYKQLGELVSKLRARRDRPRSVAIVTFNYDMGVEAGLGAHSLPVDYALGAREEGVPVLKLHGSLNWAHCDVCKQVVAWPLSEYRKKVTWESIEHVEWVTVAIGSRLNLFDHCEQVVDTRPVLVPPTWAKTERHRALKNVWQRAAHELSEAEDIFVCGFSLPESDSFFHYLYALGTVGSVPLKRFWVFNPDESGLTEARFRALLGPGAEQRFSYQPFRFDSAIGTVGSALLRPEDL